MGRAFRLLVVLGVVAGALAVPRTSRAAAPLEGVPRYDHVFTIVLENQNYDTTWNTPAPGGGQTYIQALRNQGAFANQYYGVSHVSAGNYMAITSGVLPNPLFDTDCIPSWFLCEASLKASVDGGRSIADQVEGSGQTWKAYMDGMQTPCQHPAQTAVPDPYQTGYATRHDPFVYYPPIVENPTRCNTHVVPYVDTVTTTGLATDLASAATTPNYVFITPDTCHDGHDAPCANGAPGGLKSANAWLSTEVPRILNSPAFTTQKSLLLITFDENGFSDLPGCCGALAGGGVTTTAAALGGHIGLIAIGSGVPAGKVVSTPYDHWSNLRTVESALGITEHLNMAGLPTTRSMSDLFS